MLKKLFNGGQPSNNANSSASLTETRVSGLETDEWDERTGYRQSITQLDQFEDMCTSTTAFSEQLHALLPDSSSTPSSASTSSPTKRPNDEALGLINMFRVSAIAPLQSLLILVPQLRVRCEHRRSAMQLMLRYQRKVQDIERASKTKSESTRLQRNRAKLQAATARFRDLDNHVQQEIRIIVSNDVAAIVERPTRELLLRAQLLAGQFAVESASPFMAATAVPQATGQKTERDDPNQEGIATPSNTQEPQQQVPTPQRRMAMTVLPLADENNNKGSSHCYVRQSILGPPTQPRLSLDDANTREQLRQPSTTASEDDQSVGGDDSEGTGVDASGYEAVAAEIHEDYGIGKLKKHVHGTRTWDIHQLIKDNMSTGLDLVECVRLPDGFARDEWIAVHVVDFFNEINLLYGTISEFCTAEVCPRMSAGPCYAYTWTDAAASAGASVSATHLPAAQYVARLMDWIEHQISDPRVFPSNAMAYQPDFELQVARVILKRLFRVYAHMYHSHLDHFAALSADAHLGFCFKRFVFFITHFELVDQKELHALRKLVQSVLETPEATLLPVSAGDDDDAPERQ